MLERGGGTRWNGVLQPGPGGAARYQPIAIPPISRDSGQPSGGGECDLFLVELVCERLGAQATLNCNNT
jgi:hypothetical protein